MRYSWPSARYVGARADGLSAVEQGREFASRGRCSLQGKEVAGPNKFEAARDPVPVYTL